MTIERRMHPRVPFRAYVSICWLVGNEVVEISAKGVDLSGYGMLVEARTYIPIKTYVSVKVSQFAYSGNATVVRTDRRGSRIVIGLHFSTLIPFYVQPIGHVDEVRRLAKRSRVTAKLVCFLRGHDFEIATDWTELALKCRRCGWMSHPQATVGYGLSSS
jgi:PilZ domain